MRTEDRRKRDDRRGKPQRGNVDLIAWRERPSTAPADAHGEKEYPGRFGLECSSS
jgi:hypothetical protein